AAHMFFAPGVKRLLRTHPSLADRIRELDPHFNPKQLSTLAASALKTVPAFSAAEMVKANPADLVRDPTKLVTLAAAAAVIPDTQPPPVAVQPAAVATKVGQLETLHIAQARELRLALPESLREFVESTGRARALVLALLLSRDDAVRERQFELLAKTTSDEDLAIIRATLPVAMSLEPMLRLPALLQIFPALRRLAIADRQTLAKVADNLIRADARVDVFEFCLAHLLATLLRDELEARAPHGNLTLADGETDIQVLFAMLAQFGTDDPREARMAYEAGMQTVLPMRRPPYLAIEDWPQRLADSLRRLEKLQP